MTSRILAASGSPADPTARALPSPSSIDSLPLAPFDGTLVRHSLQKERNLLRAELTEVEDLAVPIITTQQPVVGKVAQAVWVARYRADHSAYI